MLREKNLKLKIVSLGFDWNNIGVNNPTITMSKLERDGLRTDINEFVLLYAGNKIRRKVVRNAPFFSLWHFTFLTRLRVLYDLFFIIYLPFILIYERFRPNVFYLSDFSHILSVIIPAKISKAKIYFRLVNLPTELALTKGVKGKIFYCYYKLMEKLSTPFVNYFIAINKTTKQYLINLGVSEKKIVIDIPDTITRDVQFINKADKNYIRRKHNIPLFQKIILSVGSLIKEKGFFELVETFAKLERDDLVLLICGEGEKKEDLKKLSDKLKLGSEVIFAGRIGREEIWHYYVGADIFMLFSKSESLGMVFWEAMHIGLPVIGTPVGGVKETIGNDGERGFFWKGDMDDLKNKIYSCLHDETKKEREEMIERAKNYIKEKLKLKKTINDIYEK